MKEVLPPINLEAVNPLEQLERSENCESMKEYKRKPKSVYAFTFDELVEFGRQSGANIVNGMPWHFQYNGCPITHEDNNTFLLAFPSIGGFVVRMTRSDILVVEDDDLSLLSAEHFYEQYEAAN